MTPGIGSVVLPRGLTLWACLGSIVTLGLSPLTCTSVIGLLYTSQNLEDKLASFFFFCVYKTKLDRALFWLRYFNSNTSCRTSSIYQLIYITTNHHSQPFMVSVIIPISQRRQLRPRKRQASHTRGARLQSQVFKAKGSGSRQAP